MIYIKHLFSEKLGNIKIAYVYLKCYLSLLMDKLFWLSEEAIFLIKTLNLDIKFYKTWKYKTKY